MTDIRDPRPRKTGYLPSLDGWRAIAVVGVMLTHDRSWTFFGHPLSTYMGYGGYGVYLFFAISGFLITTRILEEESLVGHFHIGRFYIRRIFRIQPASLAYLLAMAILILFGWAHFKGDADSWRSWTSSLLLYVNFTYQPTNPNILTGHFWTLAVEEHFYILLSLTLFAFRKYRVLAVALLFAAFTLPLVLLSNAQGPHWYYPQTYPRSTQWQLTPLLLAALVALLVRRPVIRRFADQILQPWVAFAATILIILAGPQPFGGIGHTHLFGLIETPIRYALAIGAASLSYFFIEKPFVRKGHKLAPSATPGRPELADIPVEAPDSDRPTTTSVPA
jgi:peptidoglycan/LPS O-acetylase OafA/YrhL